MRGSAELPGGESRVRRPFVVGLFVAVLGVALAWSLLTPPDAGDVGDAPSSVASSSGGASPSPPASPSSPGSADASATPEATSPPPEVTAVVGFGAGVQGGAGGAVLTVATSEELVDALLADGPRIVRFDVPAGGATLTIPEVTILDGELTIDGSTAAGPVTIHGFVRIAASDVVVQHVRFRPGDQVDGNPDDIDGLTINGRTDAVHDIVVNHVSMSWGPDVGGLTILGDVADVTVQYSIMGPGLSASAHSEGGEGGGHAYAANVAEQRGGHAQRITFYRNLFTNSDKRGPAVQGAECVDLIENTHYNFGDDSANGNPRSLNVVNGWYRSGPLRQTTNLWRTQEWRDDGSRDDSLYIAGNVADGFDATIDAPDAAMAQDPRCGGLSVIAAAADVGHRAVLEGAGATLPVRDEVDEQLMADVRNRQGTWWNGEGFPPPNPYWPY
jgi:hypothetical protein